MQQRRECLHPNPEAPKRRKGVCLLCKRDREREYYHRVYSEKKRALVRKWAEANPGYQNRPEARAYFNAWMKQDRQCNPEKYAEYERRKRARHGALLRARNKVWRSQNRAHLNAVNRARKAKVTDHIGITQLEWEGIIASQKGRCMECKNRKKLTMDHVDPISHGGVHAPYNIQGLCIWCNIKKSNRLFAGTQMGLILTLPQQAKKPGSRRQRKTNAAA